MKLLVTGGTGYLGARAALHFAARGWNVHVTTRRFAAGLPTALARVGVELFPVDWRDADRACAALAERGIDHVLHCHGTNELVAAADPARALDETAGDTARLLRVLTGQAIRRLIYLSTVHVYGAPLAGNLDEESPCRPRHPYAIAHRCAEDFVLASSGATTAERIVFRLSNVVGAPAHGAIDRWTLLANDLARQAVTSGVMRLRSTGRQQRNFLPMTDFLGAIEHVLSDRWTGASGVYNLAGPLEQTVLELAECLRQRAEAMLGRAIAIEVPEGPSTTGPAHHVATERLGVAGFRAQGDLIPELDELLRFCRTAPAATAWPVGESAPC